MLDTNRLNEEPTMMSWLTVAFAWVLVGFPLLWGIWKTIEKAAKFFLY